MSSHGWFWDIHILNTSKELIKEVLNMAGTGAAGDGPTSSAVAPGGWFTADDGSASGLDGFLVSQWVADSSLFKGKCSASVNR